MSNREKKGSEPKKAVYDFTKVMVETEIDKFVELNLSKDLGNEIHSKTSDIGLDDVARKIYHEGKAEMTNEQAQIVCLYVNHESSKFNIAARQALTKVLTPKK